MNEMVGQKTTIMQLTNVACGVSMMYNIKINNIPSYAKNYKYIVVTLVDGELWFYGAYNEYEKAKCVSEETPERLIVENNLEVDNTKHGSWIVSEYEFLDCSVCGHSVYTGWESSSEAVHRLADGDAPNYCPNCGSKMDNMSK